ncbi:ComEC/Rec2 family competence protein [Ureaplasma diversum]|uniref:ComEC/Rec2-related protein domain-containing protein n=1 Tax=Ureaplasma diversum NCTC 246 TaxID=1188241 RepID=A0A084EXK4_9BACT|nr:ComEC/Rec2 family competence protein [Ureaplasma diversum]KEZ22696.1 hypothetical protein UDIV_5030 [Ureaplasma diversum NCTC 246]
MLNALKRVGNKFTTKFINTIQTELVYTNWIYLLILASSLVCAYTYNNFLILLVNLPLIKYFIDFKFNYKVWLLIGLTIAIVIILWAVTPYNTTLKTLITNYNNKTSNSPKTLIVNYIKDHYPNKNTQSFLLLLLLNLKTNYGFSLQLYHLNLAHLFVVSGLHLSCFVWIINKIFKKKLMFVQTLILLVFIGFYAYLLDFSASCLRVLIGLLFRFSSFKKINKVDLLAINGLICGLINVYSLKTLAFIFSYGCVLILQVLNQRLKIAKLAKGIVISLCLFAFSIAISVSLNKQINILGLVFGYSFFLPVIVSYHLCFWCFFIPNFNVVADWISNQFVFVIEKIGAIDVAIVFSYIDKLYLIIYFICYMCGLMIYFKTNPALIRTRV